MKQAPRAYRSFFSACEPPEPFRRETPPPPPPPPTALATRHQYVASSSSSFSSLGGGASSAASPGPPSPPPPPPRRREAVAWAVAAAQTLIILLGSTTGGSRSGGAPEGGGGAGGAALRMNNRGAEYYEGRRQRIELARSQAQADLYRRQRRGQRRGEDGGGGNPYLDKILSDGGGGAGAPAGSSEPFYESPVVHPEDGGLVSRTWHSNGSPRIHPGLKRGTCWCSADEWCMCTPSVAIDVILRSGPDHVWMVRRADTGSLALMGGMIEVGETAKQAVHRELAEEMSLSLDPSTSPPLLFGFYSDPARDARRHTASVVYVVDVPLDAAPAPGDDAAEAVRVGLSDVDHRTFFVDHKTILRDYRAAAAAAAGGRYGGAAAAPTMTSPAGEADGAAGAGAGSTPPLGSEAFPVAAGEPARRSVCPLPA